MGKTKRTLKGLKAQGYTVFKVGYCNLQHLLKYTEPFGYATRLEGWACDYYLLGNNIVISTGYSPKGNDLTINQKRKIVEANDKALMILRYGEPQKIESELEKIKKDLAKYLEG